MSLVEHAQRELRLCGQFDEDPAYAQSIVAAVAAFASYGHSGGSAGCAVYQLVELLNFRPLSPLTADPDDWMEVGSGMWQSRRRPDAFSTDGGVTHYLLDEPALDDGTKRLHQSMPAREAAPVVDPDPPVALGGPVDGVGG